MFSVNSKLIPVEIMHQEHTYIEESCHYTLCFFLHKKTTLNYLVE